MSAARWSPKVVPLPVSFLNLQIINLRCYTVVAGEPDVVTRKVPGSSGVVMSSPRVPCLTSFTTPLSSPRRGLVTRESGESESCERTTRTGNLGSLLSLSSRKAYGRNILGTLLLALLPRGGPGHDGRCEERVRKQTTLEVNHPHVATVRLCDRSLPVASHSISVSTASLLSLRSSHETRREWYETESGKNRVRMACDGR